MKHIAVYGSLKKGKYNHPLLEDSKFIGYVSVSGELYKVSSYPALVMGDGSTYQAELYEVDDRTYDIVYRMELGAGYIERKEKYRVGDSEYEASVFYAGDVLKDHCIKNCTKIEEY